MTDIAPKLQWKGVSKRFNGGAPVLDKLDLSVAPGRSLVIIGGSGQGKSVTIKTALGLVRPDAGEIYLDGERTVALSERQRRSLFSRVGVLFQGAALFDSLTVWENVAFRLLNADGVPRKEAKALAIEALGRVRLGPQVADLFPSDLSGGMQKRVGLARAIAANPEIIFFDEPTTGLDPIMADVINDLIVSTVKDVGATALSITHDMTSARKISDRIAMIYQGKIVWHGPTAEIDHSGNPYVDQFIHGRAEGPIKMAVKA